MSTPSRVIDKIHDAVVEAISADIDVRTFMREAQQSWSDVLRDKERADNKAFNEILDTKYK